MKSITNYFSQFVMLDIYECIARPHSFLRETSYMCFRVRTISASLTFSITVYEGSVLFKLCTGHNFMAHLDPWSYEQQHFGHKTLIRMKNCCDLCLFKCAVSRDRDRFTCLFESPLRQQRLCIHQNTANNGIHIHSIWAGKFVLSSTYYV